MPPAVTRKHKRELHQGFPEIAAVPAQKHLAQTLVGFRHGSQDQGAALIHGMIALLQNQIGKGPVFSNRAAFPQEGLMPPGLQDARDGLAPIC